MKPGKEVVANVGAVAIFALMPGAGVIHIDVAGHLQGHGKDVVFFRMKAIFILDEEVVDLPGGYLNAQFVQLLFD